MDTTLHMTRSDSRPSKAFQGHLAVQIIATLLFGTFAIVAVSVAFATFWPAGLVIAIILAWRGGFMPQSAPGLDADARAEMVRDLMPSAKTRSSGNASFDAYRADMLARLENEQQSFESFLVRLREARDKTEFDQFMDDRATRAKAIRSTPAEIEDA